MTLAGRCFKYVNGLHTHVRTSSHVKKKSISVSVGKGTFIVTLLH